MFSCIAFGGPNTSAATIARTSVAPPPNIPRIGEVPTRTGVNGVNGVGTCATGRGGATGAGAIRIFGGSGAGGGGGVAITGAAGSRTGGIAYDADGAACARCAALRARIALRRMLEITAMTTMMIQTIPPILCIDYFGGCGGGCVTSGDVVPSTLLPIESRMPVSA